MSDILPHLQRLGLEQYYEALINEGFDTWETLQDIQENDLECLNFKLGHRRKLQRAITEARGIVPDRPLSSFTDNLNNSSTFKEEPAQISERSKGGQSRPEQKRKYRRHPRPDENAPEKPSSAYVLFSNSIRDEVKSQNLTFTEVARLVGERWQKLEPEVKGQYDKKAAYPKEAYNTALAEYKKTENYRTYTAYLAEFKARHSVEDFKRPRLDIQSSDSIREVDGDDVPRFSRNSTSGTSTAEPSSAYIDGTLRVTTTNSGSDAATLKQVLTSQSSPHWRYHGIDSPDSPVVLSPDGRSDHLPSSQGKERFVDGTSTERQRSVSSIAVTNNLTTLTPIHQFMQIAPVPMISAGVSNASKMSSMPLSNNEVTLATLQRSTTGSSMNVSSQTSFPTTGVLSALTDVGREQDNSYRVLPSLRQSGLLEESKMPLTFGNMQLHNHASTRSKHENTDQNARPASRSQRPSANLSKSEAAEVLFRLSGD